MGFSPWKFARDLCQLQEHAAQLRDKVAAATTKIGQQCNCGYRCDVDLGANLLEVGVSDEQLSEEERQTFDISYSSRVLIESEARMAELAEMSLEELADAGYRTLSLPRSQSVPCHQFPCCILFTRSDFFFLVFNTQLKP